MPCTSVWLHIRSSPLLPSLQDQSPESSNKNLVILIIINLKIQYYLNNAQKWVNIFFRMCYNKEYTLSDCINIFLLLYFNHWGSNVPKYLFMARGDLKSNMDNKHAEKTTHLQLTIFINSYVAWFQVLISKIT